MLLRGFRGDKHHHLLLHGLQSSLLFPYQFSSSFDAKQTQKSSLFSTWSSCFCHRSCAQKPLGQVKKHFFNHLIGHWARMAHSENFSLWLRALSLWRSASQVSWPKKCSSGLKIQSTSRGYEVWINIGLDCLWLGSLNVEVRLKMSNVNVTVLTPCSLTNRSEDLDLVMLTPAWINQSLGSRIEPFCVYSVCYYCRALDDSKLLILTLPRRWHWYP